MSTRVEFTLRQGTHFLRMAHNFPWPEKMGDDKTFTRQIQAVYNREIRQLFKALKVESPIFREERRLYFGPREAWRRIERSASRESETMPEGLEPERVKYECLSPNRKIEVQLTGQARKGLYRLLYASAYPLSPICLAGGDQEEKVWPLAEQIKSVKALEKDTGTDETSTEVDWDDQPDLDTLMNEQDGNSKEKEGKKPAEQEPAKKT